MKILKTTIILIIAAFYSGGIQAQIDARLFRYPDVSKDHITFSYGGDIWVVDKTGGTAHKLSSPDGEETWPRFSPDGSHIAFSGNYDGNTDVYVVPSQGGVAERVTWHGGSDRVLGWHPDGSRVLFVSSRKSGRQRYGQFYLISRQGGLAEKLPVPYGENASFSADGNEIVYTDKSRIFRTWKRYRGGMAPDITRFNLQDRSHSRVAPHIANDELPMWSDSQVYFLSDRGPEKRYNLWVHNLESDETRQLTQYSEFDVHHPSMGPGDIVFEADGKLHLMSLADESVTPVEISVVSDQQNLKPRIEEVKELIQNAHISQNGKRVVAEARGELFSLPAEKGYVKNLTHTSGSAERFPAWSPDGKKIAFWSDRSGEYQLHLLDLEDGTQQKLTDYDSGYRYKLYWSPNSEMLAFVDQTMAIKIFDARTNQTIEVDKGLWMTHGGLSNFSVDWSADSRWMAYDRGEENRSNSIFIWDTQNSTRKRVTSPYYNETSPVFDPEGKYLYFITNRSFDPEYSDFDNSFVYTNSEQILALSLQKDTPPPTAPENDEAAMDHEKDDEQEKENGEKEPADKNDNDTPEPVKIDFEGLEQRAAIIPIKAGNYNHLSAVKGKVIFHDYTGSEDGKRPVKYYDLEEEEEKTIIDNARQYLLSGERNKMLVAVNGGMAVIDVKPDQKPEKMISLDEMETTVDPRAEWQQIFHDAWRFERDFFYDKNMHGVDWQAIKDYYGGLLDDAATRWDVNYLIGEMIAELNASHTYRYGGDTEQDPDKEVGYLGIDWERDDGHYRVKKIIRGAPWDAEVHSPLSMPDVDTQEGDYILAVNGIPLTTEKEPYSAFQGLAGKVVELTVNDEPTNEGVRKEIVKTMGSETRLRHLEWIENNRKTVEEATNGRAGYIYVRSTGIDGQNELVRQFSGQWHKDALIIDERFNSGGQIPDRFIELLNRKPLAYWAVRDGKNWQWPPVANFGPKAMLINGWSGSGGDAFPDFFKKAGLGPLIGTRTWGGLIGISGAPPLIDGGIVTVPTFRMYHPDGTWFEEGHGVEPDIPVEQNPTQLSEGTDVQLKKAIEWIMQELEENPPQTPEPEEYEKR
ncbi:MAG: PD40 domain-containing protein [Bacteroidales bacterium]|nr:PD40 domain-containing protein [Bacteroidales bacterium]